MSDLVQNVEKLENQIGNLGKQNAIFLYSYKILFEN